MNKIKIILLITTLVFVIAQISFSQEKVNLNDKIKKLKGKVTTVVIKTTEGELKLEGAEAEKALTAMKKSNKVSDLNIKKLYLSDIDEDENFGVFFNKRGGCCCCNSHKWTPSHKDVKIILGDDIDELCSSDAEGCEKRQIKIEDKDGKKVVQITTTKDGNENVEVLEGKQAEEWIEKHKTEEMKIGDKKCKVLIFKDGEKTDVDVEELINNISKDGKKAKKIIIQKKTDKEEKETEKK